MGGWKGEKGMDMGFDVDVAGVLWSLDSRTGDGILVNQLASPAPVGSLPSPDLENHRCVTNDFLAFIIWVLINYSISTAFFTTTRILLHYWEFIKIPDKSPLSSLLSSISRQTCI